MPPKKKGRQGAEKKFCLLRWLEDETVSVLPTTAATTGQNLYSGVYAEFKWLKKVYEVEVLKISEDRQALLKDCDRLVRMEISREDILKDETDTVDSTTDVEASPEKKPPVTKKNDTKIARKAAARERAKALLSSLDSYSGDDVIEHKTKKVKVSMGEHESLLGDKRRYKPKIKVMQTNERKHVDLHFDQEATSTKNFSKNDYSSSDDEDVYSTTEGTKRSDSIKDVCSGLHKERDRKQLEEEIKMLKKKLAQGRPSTVSTPAALSVTNNTIRHSTFEALQKFSIPTSDTGHIAGSLQDSDTKISEENVKQETTGASPSMGYKVQPKAVELVPGYGVCLTQKQLDVALDNSKNSPTRLIRNLMNVFFSPQTLATSSACGARKHTALDGDIMQACIHYVKMKYDYHVSKSMLIDCINDKCANYRRKKNTT